MATTALAKVTADVGHGKPAFAGIVNLRECGPEEIRTLNLLHAMQARYRCATGPKSFSDYNLKPPKCEAVLRISPS